MLSRVLDRGVLRGECLLRPPFALSIRWAVCGCVCVGGGACGERTWGGRVGVGCVCVVCACGVYACVCVCVWR